MKRGLSVGAAFAAGALAIFLLERYLARAQRVLPAGHLAQPGMARDAADAQLRETVRARLGEWVSHPRAIEVEVRDGVVRVSGQVMATELDALLMQLTGIRGVHKVHNALSVRRDSGGPSLTAGPEAPSALH